MDRLGGGLVDDAKRPESGQGGEAGILQLVVTASSGSLVDNQVSALVAVTTSVVLPSAPMARPKSDRTTFTPSSPETITTEDVIEKAKSAGMATTESNLQRLRGDQKKRTAKPAAAAKKPAKVATKPSAKKAAAKKPAAPTATKEAPPTAGGTKTDFVRAQPEGLSAGEVVAKAKAAGFEITSKSVHTIRSKFKAAKAAAKKPVVPSKAPTKDVTKPTAQKAPTAAALAVDGDVVTFRKLVLGLGTVRARELLDELERGLAALIRG